MENYVKFEDPKQPTVRFRLLSDFALLGSQLNTDLQARQNIWGLKIRQSKINSRLVAGSIGQTNRRPSV